MAAANSKCVSDVWLFMFDIQQNDHRKLMSA